MNAWRHAFRALKRSPGFTAAAVATLALGIGSAVLVFAVLYSVVLRPFPYHDPGRLVFIWIDDVQRNIHEEGLSYPTFLDWKSRAKTFADIAVRGRGDSAVLTGAEPERVLIDVVSANFLPVLGVRPLAGRLFTAEEESRGSLVAVISDRLARRRFGSASAAVGRALELDSRIWRVVGVIPTRMGIPPSRQDIWAPARKFPVLERFITRRSSDFFMGIGRLRAGVSVAQAQAELNVIGRDLAREYPINDPDFGGYGARVVPFEEQIVGVRFSRMLWMVMGAVGLVLLIACVNVANLLLARGASRQSELAIRTALGARMSTLVREQMMEGLLLPFCGGALGLALAAVALRVLPFIAPSDLPRFDDLHMNGPVLLFTLAAAAAACVLFGVAPSWMAARRDPMVGLRGAGARVADAGSGRLQSALVVAEFALADHHARRRRRILSLPALRSMLLIPAIVSTAFCFFKSTAIGRSPASATRCFSASFSIVSATCRASPRPARLAISSSSAIPTTRLPWKGGPPKVTSR